MSLSDFKYEKSDSVAKPSAGLISSITVQDNGDNTVTVSEVTARLFTTSNYTGNLVDYVVKGGTFLFL